jgi:hypothetical protein
MMQAQKWKKAEVANHAMMSDAKLICVQNFAILAKSMVSDPGMAMAIGSVYSYS